MRIAQEIHKLLPVGLVNDLLQWKPEQQPGTLEPGNAAVGLKTLVNGHSFNMLLDLEWYPPWHFKKYIWHLLGHLFWHSIWHILRSIWSIFSGIYSRILSDMYSGILSDIYFDILSDTYSDSLSGILFWDLFWRLKSGSAHCDWDFVGWGPSVPTAIVSWPLRSGDANCDRELAVELGDGRCDQEPAWGREDGGRREGGQGGGATSDKI